MYRNRYKPLVNIPPESNDTEINTTPCECLGTRIQRQMYSGVDSSVSTLLHGQFDDDDSWDVDPACDMSTDRFDLDLKERVPV
ncbi:MAG: hypothetical protein J6R16_04695, partial [Alistipes sp.]|nr:hypothetical protein [Alistipes sp.]